MTTEEKAKLIAGVLKASGDLKGVRLRIMLELYTATEAPVLMPSPKLAASPPRQSLARLMNSKGVVWCGVARTRKIGAGCIFISQPRVRMPLIRSWHRRNP